MAAYHAARRGLLVLLLDKQSFPRSKPCGGGLTPKTLRALPFDIAPAIKVRCQNLAISFNIAHEKELPPCGVICSMTTREIFDDLLRLKAMEAGATFRTCNSIQHVTQDERGVTLALTGQPPIRCRYLIAADGAKSAIRRLIHPHAVVSQVFALEGLAKPGLDTRILFDFFAVPSGYGWVFPKGDHLNVGIISFSRRIKLSRKQLLDYCRNRLGHNDLHDIVGHPLGIGPRYSSRSVGRVLFVGDAAGSVESLLGEGIYYAVTSGRAAGVSVSATLSPRIVRLCYWWKFLPQQLDLITSSVLRRLFYSFPSMCYGVIASPSFRRALAKGFVDGLRLDQILRRKALLRF